MAAPAVAPDGIWLTPAEAAAMLRVSTMTVTRLLLAGDIPGLRARRAYRVPAAFVDGALTAIRAGASVDLAEFGREWKDATAYGGACPNGNAANSNVQRWKDSRVSSHTTREDGTPLRTCPKCGSHGSTPCPASGMASGAAPASRTGGA
jgi:excisionase family DNA binding protein